MKFLNAEDNVKKHVTSVSLVCLLLMGWAHSKESLAKESLAKESLAKEPLPTKQMAPQQLGNGYVLNKGTLSTATHRSQQGPFEIKALVGETGVGLNSNGQGPHQLISGLIQPNYDLIFKNDWE